MPNRPKTKGRSVRVPDDLWQSAQDRAKERGETVTDPIVRALRDYTEQTSSTEHASPGEHCAHPACAETRHLHAYKLDRREDDQAADQGPQATMTRTQPGTQPTEVDTTWTAATTGQSPSQPSCSSSAPSSGSSANSSDR